MSRSDHRRRWDSGYFGPRPHIREVMRRELSRLRSNATIEVINSGRVGDTIPNNIARFERDVFAHTPDLVIWQLGTNDVAWGGRPDQGLKRSVLEGVRALKAGSADVVLMDLQYAPQVLASASYSTMEGIIADVAKQERVGLFSRFALMRNSINAGVAQSAACNVGRIAQHRRWL